MSEEGGVCKIKPSFINILRRSLLSSIALSHEGTVEFSRDYTTQPIASRSRYKKKPGSLQSNQMFKRLAKI